MKTTAIRWALPLLLLLSCALAAPGDARAQTCPGGCDDLNACTDDTCDAVLGCRHAFNSGACSDGNACTDSDVCHLGTCVGGPPVQGCSACEAVSTLPAAGGVFAGTTSGAGTLSAACSAATSSAPEHVYAWTPASSGVAQIRTCGTGTQFNTVLSLRTDSCTGTEIACNDDAPCATGASASQGSTLTPTVTAGQTYYIVVDGAGEAGAYSLTVQPPQTCGNGVREGTEVCDGSDAGACTSGACNASCTCVPPSGGLSDLVPEITDWSVQFNTSVDPGDVAEGCAESVNNVDILRLGLRVHNAGTKDLVFGPPGCPSPCTEHPLEVCGNPLFICSPAAGHNHAHFTNWAKYELIDSTSEAFVIGHKQGFCVEDLSCSSGTAKFTCSNQGLTVGCADTYASYLGCQYIDVTGVPPGNYTLRATVDQFDLVDELNDGNNVVEVPVTIPTSPAAARRRSAGAAESSPARPRARARCPRRARTRRPRRRRCSAGRRSPPARRSSRPAARARTSTPCSP